MGTSPAIYPSRVYGLQTIRKPLRRMGPDRQEHARKQAPEARVETG